MTGPIVSLPPVIELPPGTASGNPTPLSGFNFVYAVTGLAQTWTGVQTFNNGTMQFAGSTSGSTILNATAVASGVLTLPSETGILATQAFVVGQAATVLPLMDGVAAIGASTTFARADHVHPTDTSRAPIASPALTGTPTAPTATAGTNTTQLATTAFVTNAVGTLTMLNALDYGVKGDGVTNDSAAAQTFINTCNTKGMIAYFPGGKTYDFAAGSVVVPAGTTVFNGAGALFRRSASPANYAAIQAKTNVMFRIGSNCRFYGGTITKTSTLGTSSTSVTVATGSKSFTTQDNLGILNGDFMRVWSSGVNQAYMEGTVTSYSSIGGGNATLVINATFSGGSGAHSDWLLDWEYFYQTAISFDNCTNSILDGTTVSGWWYEGFLFDGWNSSGTSLTCTNCVTRNCFALGILNRAFDVYGNILRCKIHGCTVDGTGIAGGGGYNTDYGINCNAANNPSTQGQSIVDCVISDCTITKTQFQGIAMGDNCFHNMVSNCTVNDMANSASVGYELVYANGNPPQFNTFTGCMAQSVVGKGFGLYGTNYPSLNGCSAFSCGTGFDVLVSTVNTQEANILNIMAVGCTTGDLRPANWTIFG